MKTGLNRKTMLQGVYESVLLDVWDVNTNKVVFTGVAKAVSKFIPCKLSNVNSALRNGSTCQKKYKVKYQGDKRSFQCKPCGTKSQAEWDTMTDDQKKERVKRNMEIWDEHQKTTALSNKETEESATRLEAIYDQIEKEASEAALMWPWGYSQRDYEDGKPRPAMVVNAMRKEYYKKGAIPYGEKLHEAKEILREVFQKHESGLLPDRFVYDKIKKFLYGE